MKCAYSFAETNFEWDGQFCYWANEKKFSEHLTKSDLETKTTAGQRNCWYTAPSSG